MRTSRLVSLMIALVAAIIWVVSTYANASNSWDPLNFVLRIAAGAVTIAAAAEWLVLSVRESRRERLRDGRTTGVHAGGSRRRARRGVRPVPGPEPAQAPAVPSPEPAPPRPEPVVPRPEQVAPSPEPVVSSPTAAVRRSAGSGTVADKLLSVLGRRRSPAQDLAVVAAGGAVLVVAYLMERKVRRVVVRVGLDAASVASLESVLGAAPHRVFGTQQPSRGLFERSAYTQVEGASRSGAWSIAVPTADVDLLRYVLARADEVR
ncbi:hypothetical protein [Promicromonospora sp. NPDC060271]|uniref:hypothetical protein n=1 Tax=Promicromonospora sp. NPDC060271 TaxID=3347089 RepID=UPI0036694A7A